MLRSAERPISDNTENAGLRRLDYSSDEMTGHGFRTMASTLLNELGWNPDAIERQLAHGERDESRALCSGMTSTHIGYQYPCTLTRSSR